MEIGAFLTPIKRQGTIFVDKYREFARQKVLADYYGDATALPFCESSLDYVVASHVIEHVANPVKALLEWYRVLKRGGIIYMVVPDRRYTFDRDREVTRVDHILNDYRNKVTNCDSSHIEDYVDNVDLKYIEPWVPEAALPDRRRQIKTDCWAAIHGKQELDLHFHVFEPQTMKELIQEISRLCEVRWRIVDFAERYPEDRLDGFLLVIQSEKEREPFGERLKRFVKSWSSRTYPLTEEAVPME